MSDYDDFIPPEVIIVGGFQRNRALNVQSQPGLRPSNVSTDPHHIHAQVRAVQPFLHTKRHSSASYGSMQILDSGYLDSRRSSAISAYSTVTQTSTFDTGKGHPMQDFPDLVFRRESPKEERRRLKQESREKTVSNTDLPPRRSYSSGMVSANGSYEQNDHMTLTEMLHSPVLENNSIRRPSLATSQTESKESSHRKSKGLDKAEKARRKEEEKTRKEAEKLTKLRLAVESRNAKIDAQERNAREKAATKARLKKQREEAQTAEWNLLAKQDSEQIWGSRQYEMMMKARELQT